MTYPASAFLNAFPGIPYIPHNAFPGIPHSPESRIFKCISIPLYMWWVKHKINAVYTRENALAEFALLMFYKYRHENTRYWLLMPAVQCRMKNEVHNVMYPEKLWSKIFDVNFNFWIKSNKNPFSISREGCGAQLSTRIRLRLRICLDA